jgi:hypothetical protein
LDDEIAENDDDRAALAGSADLRFRLLYSAASEAARRGEAALLAFFNDKRRTKDEKDELRKIKDELVALYPK